MTHNHKRSKYAEERRIALALARRDKIICETINTVDLSKFHPQGLVLLDMYKTGSIQLDEIRGVEE